MMIANKIDNIELSLPTNSAYVSAARLTSSSIAYRMGFEFDHIEDIKAAVSEACTFIIRKSTGMPNNSFKINFSLYEEYLEISINIDNPIQFEGYSEDLSISLVHSLMDETNLNTIGNKLYDLSFIKHLKQNTLNL